MDNPTPSIEMETRPVYPLGLASFILSLTPFLFLCVQVMLLFGTQENELHFSPQAIGIECLSCFGILLPVAGVILGILSLVRKEPKKIFAVAGIALSILGSLIMVLSGFISGLLFFSAL